MRHVYIRKRKRKCEAVLSGAGSLLMRALRGERLPALIAWLCVFRYDGRGALGDLRMYEPPPGGFDSRTFLKEEELRMDQLCDEERYRSLYTNDAEETMYHGTGGGVLMFRIIVP